MGPIFVSTASNMYRLASICDKVVATILWTHKICMCIRCNRNFFTIVTRISTYQLQQSHSNPTSDATFILAASMPTHYPSHGNPDRVDNSHVTQHF
jgi:hypothetical protein